MKKRTNCENTNATKFLQFNEHSARILIRHMAFIYTKKGFQFLLSDKVSVYGILLIQADC